MSSSASGRPSLTASSRAAMAPATDAVHQSCRRASVLVCRRMVGSDRLSTSERTDFSPRKLQGALDRADGMLQARTSPS